MNRHFVGKVSLQIFVQNYDPCDPIFLKLPPIPLRDLISRPIAQVSSVAGGDDATRPRRQMMTKILSKN
jgi:hypothetical protein